MTEQKKQEERLKILKIEKFDEAIYTQEDRMKVELLIGSFGLAFAGIFLPYIISNGVFLDELLGTIIGTAGAGTALACVPVLISTIKKKISLGKERDKIISELDPKIISELETDITSILDLDTISKLEAQTSEFKAEESEPASLVKRRKGY